jgi:tetratricopeptide (TPR) repeat protein
VFEAALAAYQRAHELSEPGESWHGLQLRADVYSAWPGHGQEAVEAHRKAVAVATEEADPRGMQTTIGSTLTFALSRSDLAFQAEALEAYVALNPGEVDRWFQLAKVEEARGGSADEVLARMLEVIPQNPRAHVRYATHLSRSGRSKDAFAHLESRADDGVAPTVLLSTLVARLLEAREISEAVRIVELLEQDFPEDPNTALARASLDFDQGRVEEAADQLRVLVGRSQSSAAWQLLAQVEQRRGYINEAIEAITEAIEFAEELGQPMPERALRLRAHLQVASGDYVAALRGFATLVRNGARLAPRDQVLRARALFGLGRRRAANATLAPLMNLQHPYAPAVMEFAEREFVAQPRIAQVVIEKALAAEPTNPGLLLWAARLDLAQGEHQSAIDHVQTAIQARKATPALLLERARALALTGNMELAQRDALQALQRDPNLEGAIPLLMALLETEGGESVIESFEEADAVGALQPPARYLLARLHKQAGNRERARALLEELTETEIASAKNDLAYLLAEEGVELTRAQGLAEEASRQLRGHPEAAHTLGYVFLRKNLYSAALEQFRFVVSNPKATPPLVYYHIGLALQGLERLEEAEEAFAQALTLDEGMAEAARALEEVRAMKPQASAEIGPS